MQNYKNYTSIQATKFKMQRNPQSLNGMCSRVSWLTCRDSGKLCTSSHDIWSWLVWNTIEYLNTVPWLRWFLIISHIKITIVGTQFVDTPIYIYIFQMKTPLFLHPHLEPRPLVCCHASLSWNSPSILPVKNMSSAKALHALTFGCFTFCILGNLTQAM